MLGMTEKRSETWREAISAEPAKQDVLDGHEMINGPDSPRDLDHPFDGIPEEFLPSGPQGGGDLERAGETAPAVGSVVGSGPPLVRDPEKNLSGAGPSASRRALGTSEETNPLGL
jgi:hypothetical protein